MEREKEKLERVLVKLRTEQLHGSDVQEQIDEIEEKLGDNDRLLKNGKAGWLYVINCPAFGKDTWKIGLSRRIDVSERISELSSASVPFVFKQNCILWSDDIFKLETDIHKRLDNYRVNKINKRKEFFKISGEKLEEIILNYYDKNAIFNHNNFDDNFTYSGYTLSENFITKGEKQWKKYGKKLKIMKGYIK